ncbi:DUF1826 domain-containing protein [Gammaproteobacteria bacterium]|nr:DUF1826 domain-containing protein [Gammaproteobacteria bacterium]
MNVARYGTTAVEVPQILADDQQLNLVTGSDPAVLADIYEPKTNIAIWQRSLPERLKCLVGEFVASRKQPYTSVICTPAGARPQLLKAFGSSDFSTLVDDANELIDMFCWLFDLDQVGLRMTVLREAMCPKFHVDQVPCRLVTTYCGIGTQWLPNNSVNREKLGYGSAGLSDQESGLYGNESDIRQIATADVALLKGEGWQGNQNAGLVHRSPAIPSRESRLLLTLDFSDE